LPSLVDLNSTFPLLFVLVAVVQAVADLDPVVQLSLTSENVESVLDEVRLFLMADGDNVAHCMRSTGML
jgi:hypothetical protein